MAQEREPRFRVDAALIRDRALLDLLDGAVTPAHVVTVQALLDQLTATAALDLLRLEQHAATAAAAGPR
ncbi:hypothetical protein, partial [Kibdelosporangium philippinense]